MRALLGALLLFGSEVVLWTTAHGLGALDWAWRALAYTLLAAVLLDLAVRYRVRDLYDSMALFALYGVLVSVFVAPAVALEELPRTLLTRTLGAHSLTGLLLWGVFGTLLQGGTRRTRLITVGGMFWLGFFWGVWLRWMPAFSTLFPALPLAVPLATAAGALLWTALADAAVHGAPPADLDALRLPPLAWLSVGVIGALAFLAHAASTPVYTLANLATLFGVGVVAWAVLWFRRHPKRTPLLAGCLPPRGMPRLWRVGALAAFGGASALGYALPLAQVGAFNQLWLMEMGFGAVGTLWLPVLAAAVAIEGVESQMRRNEL